MAQNHYFGRLKKLNRIKSSQGHFVLYWMQASQRSSGNHALEYAIWEANQKSLPLVVLLVVIPDYLEAGWRHYRFMLDGFEELREGLANRNAALTVRYGNGMADMVVSAARDAALLVTDRGYLWHQRKWRSSVAGLVQCPMIQVETDVVVPVEICHDREAYSAASLRPRIHKWAERFLKIPPASECRKACRDIDREDLNLLKRRLYDEMGNSSVDLMDPGMPSGMKAASRRLEQFITEGLPVYDLKRNDPMAGAVSGMSPYLHFGQISPIEIALKVRRECAGSIDAYLEELIVRRELSMNFVFFNPYYDSIKCLPDWAFRALSRHAGDRRFDTYERDQLERAETNDPYWNAAQQEMMRTGKMHGYMRMYWGKKIIEWSVSPETAYQTALYLNNKYEIDGRDPNGYAGVAWCFGKHDRPWKERSIFGSVRYMNASGLKRKFDADAYAKEYS